MVAPAGPNAEATLAVDPASDRAVAAWRTLASPGGIRYAVSDATAGYRPHPAAATSSQPDGGVHWLRITLAAIAGLAAVALVLALAARRRRRAG
jgi:hypothetical protein